MKYLSKKQIIKLSVGLPLLIGGTVGAAIGARIGLNMYSTYKNSIQDFIAPTQVLVDESSSQQAAASGSKMAKRICREGSVLVKNNDNVLPFPTTLRKVNVFGHASVDWVVGGSGSGKCSPEEKTTRKTFLDALSDNGISYNKNLTDYYRSYYDSDINSRDALNNFYDKFYFLVEPKIDKYTNILNDSKSFSDTAIVVLSRSAGESEDAPNKQYKHDYATDNSRHYLEISTEEQELLTWVGSNFTKVVVLINSTNTMELGFLDSINGLDACLVCGTTGNNGAEGIVQLLWGSMADEDLGTVQVSPSGRLSDTYPYSFDYNINANHSGIDNVNHYTNASGLYPAGVTRNAGIKTSSAPSYIDYKENIYVGYKWYETADAEGYWDKAPYQGYNKVVQFPFGYGLSYTTFDWKVKSVEPALNSNITNKDTIKITMSVKNTGSYVGMDVVQAYLTAPYTKGGIEKSAVSLVGIYKTPEIEPGKETTDFVLELKASDFESYDCYDKDSNGFKGFELEKGLYQIKLMSNSHVIKDVDLMGSTKQGILNYNVASTINVDKDEVSNATVKNLFTGSDALDGDSIDGTDDGVSLDSYVSRASFPAISLTKVSDRSIGTKARDHNLYTVEQAKAWDSATGNDIFGNPINNNKPNWGTGSKQALFKSNKDATELGLELGKDYNDPQWDAVLDSIPFNEAKGIVDTSAFGKEAKVNSVGRTAESQDADGPAQINGFNSRTKGTGYPNATVLAQSFSPNLAYQYGLSYGTDMAACGADGLYGFGCNIHRSPMQGRNYEYFSEDGFLSAVMLANEVKGLSNRGKYCFLKHLVLAETEYEREAMYVYVTEQALREIYLKPFKSAIQDANCVGIMTSYNRIGSTWAGCSEALIEGVIRGEYGFNGAIITDYSDHNQFMNQHAAFRAGSNLGMACTLTGLASKPEVSAFEEQCDITINSSGRVQNKLRDAVHQVLYTWLAPQYQKSIYVPGSDDVGADISSISINSWYWLEPIIGLEHNGLPLKLLIFGLFAVGFYFVIRPFPNKEENTEVSLPFGKNKKGKKEE